MTSERSDDEEARFAPRLLRDAGQALRTAWRRYQTRTARRGENGPARVGSSFSDPNQTEVPDRSYRSGGRVQM